MLVITIVVTTFNRAGIVDDAIRSALEFAAQLSGQVILVDDGSIDGTVESVAAKFRTELNTGQLKLIRHERNRGVTAAKNTGFDAAAHPWVAFLDSDDRLIPSAAIQFRDTLLASGSSPVVFFRCVDENGHAVGRQFTEPQVIDFARFVQHVSYGEALVVINKQLSGDAPFDADLRGYEGLGCARLIRSFGPGLLSPLVVRIYNRSGTNRLSSVTGMLKRARLIGLGHYRLLKLCGQHVPLATKIGLWFKAAAYLFVGTLHAILSPDQLDQAPDDHPSQSARG